MSDIQLLFAKSLMHMQLPRTRGILSFRNFRAGDSEKITPRSKNIINNSEDRNLNLLKRQRKYDQLYFDLPHPKQNHSGNSHLKKTKVNDQFSLCPSENSRFLDSCMEKQAKILETTASAAESFRVASLGPYASSKIIISKQFEYFENPAKNHGLCRFSIQNDSSELLAYSVSTKSRDDDYEISPNMGYVPPGRSLEISIKFLGMEFELERLHEDQIIITSFCAGFETKRLLDFIHPKSKFDSNSSSFQLKAFFRNPCAILTRNQALSPKPVEMPLVNDPKALKSRWRLKKLKNRNYCEKFFDRMQTVSENSQKELQKYQKHVQVLRILFSLISYAVFVSSIGFALYYVTYGRPVIKPKEPENILVQIFKSSKSWIEISMEFVVKTVSGLIWNDHVYHTLEKLTQWISS